MNGPKVDALRRSVERLDKRLIVITDRREAGNTLTSFGMPNRVHQARQLMSVSLCVESVHGASWHGKGETSSITKKRRMSRQGSRSSLILPPAAVRCSELVKPHPDVGQTAVQIS